MYVYVVTYLSTVVSYGFIFCSSAPLRTIIGTTDKKWHIFLCSLCLLVYQATFKCVPGDF